MNGEVASGDRPLPTVTRRKALTATAGGLFATTLSTTTVTAQQSNRQRWVFETGGRVDSSPAVVNGTIYVGSADNNFYAVNADTGEQQWVFETGDWVRSSPIVVNGTVFFGSNDGNLYAVGADTGTQQWAFETGGPVFSSPTVADGTVFVGSTDGNFYAVGTDSGQQQWTFEPDSFVTSSPTVMDETVFVGCYDNNLYAVNADTGEQQWAFETEGIVQSSPTVVDGTVFVGSNDGNLYAVDVATGKQQWAFQTGGEVFSSPTVADMTVFVGSGDNRTDGGNIYAVNADTGEQQWAFETDDIVLSSPTVVDGIVFVGSNDGNLYAVDTDTGRQQWAFLTGGEVFSSPRVAAGTVFIGGGQKLYAVDASDTVTAASSVGSPDTLGANSSGNPISVFLLNPILTVAGVAAVIAPMFGYGLYRLANRRNDETSKSRFTSTDTPTPSGSPTEETTESQSDSTATVESHKATAEAAIERAVSAKSNHNLGAAIEAYTEALTAYQTALESLDNETPIKRTEIEKAIELTVEELATVKTRCDKRGEVIESIQSGEQNLQEAIVAFAEGDQTVARVRFRQARDAFGEAIKAIEQGDIDLLTPPIEVDAQPDQELSSTTLSDLPTIPETAVATLAGAEIETIDDLESSEEPPWTPAAIEWFISDDAISNAVLITLTVLSWWNEDNSHEFDTAEVIARRQKQAVYGYNKLT